MEKSDKKGFFKRLFKGKNDEGCCSVKIEEIKETSKGDSGEKSSSEECCAQNGKS